MTFCVIQDCLFSNISVLHAYFEILVSKEFGKRRKVSKTQCPPHSPELNPLDYFFWVEVQLKVYEDRDQPFRYQAELKAGIRQVWQSASNQATVGKAILQFRPWLYAVIKAKGGPIKHLYNYNIYYYNRFSIDWILYYEAKFNVFWFFFDINNPSNPEKRKTTPFLWDEIN